MKIKSCFYFLLFLMGILFCFEKKTYAQAGAEAFYRVSRAGDDRVTISKVEYAWWSLRYQEKKMNNWYSKFWKDEGFSSPEDIYVKVAVSTMHQDGIDIIFSLTDTVIKADPSFEIHKRIAEMLKQDLSKKIKIDYEPWLQWLVAVDLSYKKEEEEKPKSKRSFLVPKLKYIVPENGDVSLLKMSVGVGRQEMKVQARDLAALYIGSVIEDLDLVYKDYLEISGLKLYRNAEIKMELSKADKDLISFVFVLDKKAARSDPDLVVHRSLAKQFETFLKRKVEPIKTDWLRFRFEADTTGKPAQRVWLTSY